MESWVEEIVARGFRNIAQKNAESPKDWNVGSKFHWQRTRIQYLESEIHRVETIILDNEF